MEDRYLYKAKRVDNKEWVQGVPFEVEGKTVILISDNENILRVHYLEENMWEADIYAVEVDPSTICQCTGLKDKNGKLIWENDVVEIGEHEDTVNGLYKVIYCENAHCYALKRSVDFHYNFFTFSDLNGFETSSKVIGNIFDNAELLESEG